MKDELKSFNLTEQQKTLTEQEIRSLVSTMLVNWTATGRIQRGYLQSSTFQAGGTGWKLDSNGTLTSVNSGNWDLAYTHSQGNGLDHSSVATHDGYLNQSVKTTATPSFAGISIGASPGVDGTFTTVDLKTVTVSKGIITSII